MFQEIINTQKATGVTARRCSKEEKDRDLHTFAHASKVLMLSQNLSGDLVEFLIGKASQSVQVN